MASLKCKCGRMTSTTVSDFMDSWPDAGECYAAIDNKTRKWVKGCAYKKAGAIDKRFADRLIGRPAIVIPLNSIETMGKVRRDSDDEDVA